MAAVVAWLIVAGFVAAVVLVRCDIDALIGELERDVLAEGGAGAEAV